MEDWVDTWDYHSKVMAGAFDAAPAPDVVSEPVIERPAVSEPIIERPSVAPDKSNAAIDASEARRIALTKELVGGKLTEAERGEKTRELRALVANQATAEEKTNIASASLETHRAAYGLEPPALPKPWQDAYAEHHEGFEQDFLAAARQHGLDKGLVTELRDTGVRLAVEAEGKPVSDETWAALEKKFSERLTPTRFKSLKAWWKTSVEGSES
jgi:hypothetical protein